MGFTRVHESAGDATQRKRAGQREKRARGAEQSAQTGQTIASLTAWRVYRYTNSDRLHGQTD
jgi:hypothetical protein